ncbi:MAG: CRISPR-associated helicase Cas3' [Promethearchaeota archaeon]
MDFNEKFKDFLKLYENNEYEFLARPKQSLLCHIRNMVEEGINYIQKSVYFNENYRNIIYLSFLFSVIFHDFGKINPYFQYKIFQVNNNNFPPLDSELKIYSYHSEISGIFSFEFIDKIAHLFELDEEEKKLIQILVWITINSHHSQYPKNDPSQILSNYERNQRQKLFEFLRNFRMHNQFLKSYSQLIFEFINQVQIRTFNGSEQEIEDALINTIDQISELSNFNAWGQYMVIDKICDLFDDKIRDLSFEDLVNYYCIILYIQSLLCDLDIWDARFYDANTKSHLLNFFDSLEPLDSNLVEKYVSDHFGKKNPNFQHLKIKKTQENLVFLRNLLFSEANSKQLEIGKIYTLSSPTGAGKTLTLINLAHKIQNLFFKSKGIYSKIIYALPYISIGSQVAEKILDLYSIEKSQFFSNNLLTIDNYLTDAAWNYSYNSESNDIIYGIDAQWLISSWRSQYIVTTFVKFYYCILKPQKHNYLRFHRIANSIILLDEIQCIPIQYWDVIRYIHKALSEIFNCTLILSTATQPAIMNSNEIVPIAGKHLEQLRDQNDPNSKIGNLINRYKIYFIDKALSLDDFIVKLKKYLQSNNQNILVVLNTRKAVFKTFNSLKADPSIAKENEIYMLSTLILPLDRLDLINELKSKLNSPYSNNKRLIIITTQLIEAGVDISLECVFRDIAPLDSIVQVAGRCNRNYEYEMGKLFIVKLVDTNNSSQKLFFNYIYNNIVFEETENILKKGKNIQIQDIFGECHVLDELQLRNIFNNYFSNLRKRRITSTSCKLIEKLNFEALGNNFSLIQEYRNQVPLFIEITDNATSVLQKIENKHYLIKEFYQYTITINKKQAEKLKSQKILEKIELDKYHNHFYLLEKKNADIYYSKITGFQFE